MSFLDVLYGSQARPLVSEVPQDACPLPIERSGAKGPAKAGASVT